MKKTYISPATDVIMLQQHTVLLSGSQLDVEVDVTIEVDNNDALVREFDADNGFDLDDEEENY